jgi:hypothetical protein
MYWVPRNLVRLKFSEKYNIKKEDLELYEILDRMPPIFDINKHVLNILSILPLNLPDNIIYNISVFLFHHSKSINLKILDFLIKNNMNLKEFVLTNNNIRYISYILEKAGYNVIFFENSGEFEPINICDKLSVYIPKYDTSKKNLMILTNCINPYYDESLFLRILDDEEDFYNFEKENVETCLNFKHAMINNNNDLKDYYHHFNYKKDHKNFMRKPLCGYQSAIHASTCWICKPWSSELICSQKKDVTTNINFRNFLYLLVENFLGYGDANFIVVLVFLNKTISFGHTYCNSGLTVIEVYENGDITIPSYTFNEIKHMRQWKIQDLLKYDFLIKDKRRTFSEFWP